MLTRIEIDGFKTFDGFSLDLMPLTVITGPNAVGKSNLFDALRLLSRAVMEPELAQAFSGLRGRPDEQFRAPAGEHASSRIRIGVECLLDAKIEDAFGFQADLKHTRVRYEIGIARRHDPALGVERLFVDWEAADPIKHSEDRWLKVASEKMPTIKERTRSGQRRNPFLETSTDPVTGSKTISARQDGVQGRPRPLPADRATATYLSTVNDAKDFPHLYALRRSLSDVLFLHADPVAERRPSDHNAPTELASDAGNLAAVLHRIKVQTRSADRPVGALADLSSDLANLVPGVVRIDVVSNDTAREFELTAHLRDGQIFSSRVLSDGTLRMLALATVANDPQRAGVFCFEEPENGVTGPRAAAVLALLRDAVEDPGAKLFQVLMNSHSPWVLAALRDHETVIADMETIVRPEGRSQRRTRMRGRDWQLISSDPEHRISQLEADELLRMPDPQNA
jgi:predicted ATPase